MGQMAILRQAKAPSDNKPKIIQYKFARQAISSCLRSPENTNHIVAATVANLEQRRDDEANGPLVRDDAQRSLEVVQTFQRSVNALDLSAGRYEAAPNPSPSLMVAGVEISVYPDALVRFNTRAGERLGEVFVRCTIGTTGENAENRRSEANGHLATIAHMHAAQHLAHIGAPHSQASMVIDVPRGRVVYGSANTTRRVQQIETACRMIAAIWPTV